VNDRCRMTGCAAQDLKYSESPMEPLELPRLLLVVTLLVTFCSVGWAEESGEDDLLQLSRGAVILAHTGQYDEKFPANALIDGRVRDYWASSRRNSKGFRPESFIIELDRPYRIHRLAVNNFDNDEMQYPGVSAKVVRFSGSTESSNGKWRLLGVVEGLKFAYSEKVLEQPGVARWLKVEVLSNHGHPRYTEISELEAYGVPLAEKPLPGIDPSGIYSTNYGLLLLKVEGERVEGCYEMDDGYVRGTTDGRVFNLEWVEHRGEEKGRAVLVLASTGFLNGLWYERDMLMGPWFGNKLPPQEGIDCDPRINAAKSGVRVDSVLGR